MKEWALEKGATHFTHWFQPLTGITAEKHDSFYAPTGDGSAIADFSGKELIQGEPDASSFPTGGIRATFEARGYTAWDPTSPAFILENPNGALLCIPTAFASWTGEALDNKIPLLRSMDALSRSAVRALSLLGDTEASKVFTTVGPEQEYFLIDEQYYFERPDLVTTGRTLFGAQPPKGHELDDHYFGSIPERVLACMLDAERELAKLGVPIKTRHNEVAPRAVRGRADLRELERRLRPPAARRCRSCRTWPAATGSSACCTRSRSRASTARASTTTGRWAPTRASTCSSRARRRTRTSSSCSSARPSSRPSTTTSSCCARRSPTPARTTAWAPTRRRRRSSRSSSARSSRRSSPRSRAARATATTPQSHLELGASVLPALPMHGGDRNRTSPFAFTGNKFEFRALGSQHVAGAPEHGAQHDRRPVDRRPRRQARQGLRGRRSLEDAILSVIKEAWTDHKRVVFDGDNYSEDWHAEAESRGLANLRQTPDALPWLVEPSTVEVFERYEVLSERELESRYEVCLEQYTTTINIEGETAAAIARTMLLPAAIKWLAHARGGRGRHRHRAPDRGARRARRRVRRGDLRARGRQHATTRRTEDVLEGAKYVQGAVIEAMGDVREVADKLEKVVPDDLWPLPKYSEVLFIK